LVRSSNWLVRSSNTIPDRSKVEPQGAYPYQMDCIGMEPWEMALRIVLLGLSAIMMIISMQAWRRNRGRRMMWVMLSFLGFFVLSLLVLLGVIWGDGAWSVPNVIVLILTLIIGANYLALLKG